jgi:hypothetical protein
MNFREQKLAKLAAKAARRPAAVAIAPKAVSVAESPAPATPATIAALSADIERTKAEIAAFKAGPAAAEFPGEHEKIHSAAYPPSESKVIHDHAVAMTKKDSTLTYRRAVEILTARRTA